MHQHQMEHIPLPILQARLAEDLIPVDRRAEMYEVVGMIPASADVAALEAEDAERRRQALIPLIPAVDMLSGLATNITTKAILVQSDATSDTDFRIRIDALPPIVLAGVRAVLAQLIDLGLVEVKGLAHDV